MVQEKKDLIICAEVYDCINILGKNYIDKIPPQLYKLLEENRDINYISKYDEKLGIKEDTFSQNALNILALLDLKYWCSEEEREEKIKIYNQNSIKKEEEAKEKYSIDNIFKKTKTADDTVKIDDIGEKQVEEKSLVVQNNNIFYKIKKFVLNLVAKIQNK